MEPSKISNFLHKLCDAADKETLPRFRKLTAIDNKLSKGFDPVTQADMASEQAIRALIVDTYPDHGIIGEELENINEDAEYCWIIDPIDGTKSFITGIPLWGTLIALFHQGKPIAGIMSQPYTSERFICDGISSMLHRAGEEQVLTTSKVSELSQAIAMTTSPNLLNKQELRAYNRLEDSCKLGRYGADCYAYCMLAAGHIELVAEAGLNLYDIAALIPIVEKAGGVVTNWQGEPAFEGGQVLAAANEMIHKQALEVLNA